jgi:hypothetical protein
MTPDLVPIPTPEPRLLRLEDAARHLSVSVKWLRAHRKELPFFLELSPRVLRVDVARMERWLERRRGLTGRDS